LSGLSSFDLASSEKAFRDLVTELGIKSGDLVHPVRVALSGSSVGPGLFETMIALGRERTVARLQAAFA
jgi:glutamyl-tRNA synthetase